MSVLTPSDARYFIASFVKDRPELGKPRQSHFFIHISLVFVILGALVWLTYHAHYAFALPLFLYAGIIQYHFTVMIHEASHAGLLQDRALNGRIGDLIGALVTFSVDEYKVPHIQHHRHLGDETEPDYFSYQMRKEYKSLPAFLFVLLCEGTAIASLKRRVTLLLKPGATPHAPDAAAANPAPNPAMEFRPDPYKLYRVAAAQLLMMGFYFALGDIFAYFIFWLAPMFLIPGIINRLRVFGEHGGMTAGPEGDKDVLARTTMAPLWQRLILSPFNFNYHHEHHLVPSVPYTSLPLVHRELKATGYYDRNPQYYSRSYIRTYAAIFSKQGTPA